ncbi:MAG: ferrous iron transport protein B [Candidatus Eiseniibacteriota bacterium]|jgi:ferrous iron transport protein B
MNSASHSPPAASVTAAAPDDTATQTPAPADLSHDSATAGSTANAEGARPADAGRLVLLGNPNVGKSVLFGYFTGRYVTVSNYPGTTVEVARGRAAGTLPGFEQVIDTPGVNTLIPQSEDERVTRDIVLEERDGIFLQVGDAKNLRRALLITLQLSEMGARCVLALNMMDEARSRGLEIDHARLAEHLGVPVMPTIAIRRQGVRRLARQLAGARRPTWQVRYEAPIERAVERVLALLPPELGATRALALMLAAGDRTLDDWLTERAGPAVVGEVRTIARELAAIYHEPIAYVLNRQRLAAVDHLVSEVLSSPVRRGSLLATRLGAIAMHPVWGVGVMAVVLALVFWFVGILGAGTLVDLLESRVFGEWINPLVTRAVDAVLPVPLLRDLLVGEYGIVTMALTYGIAIVLPIVSTFFIAFSILEDSGYLPRLAVMVNRIFRGMGLHGKAVLPMVLGLGCDTMATLTTRILDSRKERVIVTLLLALGVPCSAQLGVILGMLGGVGLAGAAVWCGVILGVLFLVGWLAARVLPGQSSEFILELPPLRVPAIGNILVKTLARIEWYLREALPLFVIGTLVLFTLDRLALLGVIERAVSPVLVGWLDLPPDAAAAFIIGFLRRDYGAAGIFALDRAGELDGVQVVVALTTMTLFIPCIANVFMMIKERGLRTALWQVVFILPFALLVGAALNWTLRALGVTFGVS